MNQVSCKIRKLNSGSLIPSQGTAGAAGYDLYAHTGEEGILIEPQTVALIPTGIAIEVPIGIEVQVRPRSGLSSKSKIIVINSPGTIDSDYRGEIFVPLYNLSTTGFLVTPGMRIAQIVFARYEQVVWEEVSELSNSPRGTQGFGSTGL
jgi:dUTP pyrophosphatase